MSRAVKVSVKVWGVWFSLVAQREVGASGGRKAKREERDLEIEFRV